VVTKPFLFPEVPDLDSTAVGEPRFVRTDSRGAPVSDGVFVDPRLPIFHDAHHVFDLAVLRRNRRLGVVSGTATDRAHTSAPTLPDVASAVGLSLVTASRGLNGSARTGAEDYRERVQAAATLLAYTAEIPAQAIGAMSAIREAGRLVGADIALCGFGDIPAGRDVTPGLTTVRVPLEEVGYRALRAAVDDDGDADARPLPLEVLLRESTPPARSA
jgi:hypothetical protein